jgi:beta-lactamase class A
MTHNTLLIERKLEALDAQSALYAKHLKSGEEIAIRADEHVNTLSVIKLAIMILAYRDADAGFLDLGERYTIGREDLRRGSGLLQTFDLGLQPTYRDLVTQMIITSDNTATDIMIAHLGLARVNEMLESLGYVETRLKGTSNDLFRRVLEVTDPSARDLSPAEVYQRGLPMDPETRRRLFDFAAAPAEWLGQTTARETGRLLEQLVQGELASPASTEAMESALKQQFYASRMPRRIYERVAVGHKTGDWPPLAGNDVGIIYSQSGPIVVSLFITHNRGSFLELEAAHGAIAETILNAWEQS